MKVCLFFQWPIAFVIKPRMVNARTLNYGLRPGGFDQPIRARVLKLAALSANFIYYYLLCGWTSRLFILLAIERAFQCTKLYLIWIMYVEALRVHFKVLPVDHVGTFENQLGRMLKTWWWSTFSKLVSTFCVSFSCIGFWWGVGLKLACSILNNMHVANIVLSSLSLYLFET